MASRFAAGVKPLRPSGVGDTAAVRGAQITVRIEATGGAPGDAAFAYRLEKLS